MSKGGLGWLVAIGGFHEHIRGGVAADEDAVIFATLFFFCGRTAKIVFWDVFWDVFFSKRVVATIIRWFSVKNFQARTRGMTKNGRRFPEVHFWAQKGRYEHPARVRARFRFYMW